MRSYADAIDCVSAMERFPTLLELWVEVSDQKPMAEGSAGGSNADHDHDTEMRFFEELAQKVGYAFLFGVGVHWEPGVVAKRALS